MPITQTPLTELEAVNLCLESVGQAPADTIESVEGASPDVARALRTLRATSLDLQQKGWSFNTEHRYPLALDDTGQIPLAPNMLFVDPDGDYADVDGVMRGQRLYDRGNHTFTFTTAPTATVIFLLPFGDLPSHARTLVALRAARTFQSMALGSQTADRELQRMLASAEVAFAQIETNAQDLNVFKDSDSVLDGWLTHRDPYIIPRV